MAGRPRERADRLARELIRPPRCDHSPVDMHMHRRSKAPQQQVGQHDRLLAKLELAGDERVLQVGGDGELALALAGAVPRGSLAVVELAAMHELDVPENVQLISGGLSAVKGTSFDAAALASGISRTGDCEPLFRAVRTLLRSGARVAGYGEEEGLLAHVRACTHGVAAQEPYARYISVPVDESGLAGAEDTESQLFAAGFSFASCRLLKLPAAPARDAHDEALAAQAVAAMTAQLPQELCRPFERDVNSLVGSGAERVRLVIEALA